MAEYLAMRIKAGAMDYEVVTKKYPQYKEAVDEILGGN